ncbi:hypothetical protein B0H16DRAFT_1485955 [Mycena metata]|uniref:Uncharacterized protein n=1 Tax=Mycena metata TaxID=1033252 RepID=A0AAD7GJI4_9AGAR|nr:hypothetical protein B0H16DRAFT_1485955 [Mycena metata]
MANWHYNTLTAFTGDAHLRLAEHMNWRARVDDILDRDNRCDAIQSRAGLVRQRLLYGQSRFFRLLGILPNVMGLTYQWTNDADDEWNSLVASGALPLLETLNVYIPGGTLRGLMNFACTHAKIVNLTLSVGSTPNDAATMPKLTLPCLTTLQAPAWIVRWMGPAPALRAVLIWWDGDTGMPAALTNLALHAPLIDELVSVSDCLVDHRSVVEWVAKTVSRVSRLRMNDIASREYMFGWERTPCLPVLQFVRYDNVTLTLTAERKLIAWWLETACELDTIVIGRNTWKRWHEKDRVGPMGIGLWYRAEIESQRSAGYSILAPNLQRELAGWREFAAKHLSKRAADPPHPNFHVTTTSAKCEISKAPTVQWPVSHVPSITLLTAVQQRLHEARHLPARRANPELDVSDAANAPTGPVFYLNLPKTANGTQAFTKRFKPSGSDPVIFARTTQAREVYVVHPITSTSHQQFPPPCPVGQSTRTGQFHYQQATPGFSASCLPAWCFPRYGFSWFQHSGENMRFVSVSWHEDSSIAPSRWPIFRTETWTANMLLMCWEPNRFNSFLTPNSTTKTTARGVKSS